MQGRGSSAMCSTVAWMFVLDGAFERDARKVCALQLPDRSPQTQRDLVSPNVQK